MATPATRPRERGTRHVRPNDRPLRLRPVLLLRALQLPGGVRDRRLLHLRLLRRARGPAAYPASGAPPHGPGETEPMSVLPATPQVMAVLVENRLRFLSFLERRVGSREVAEDILQDAFVRGLDRLDQLREEDSVVAWFYRALRNAVVDHWRRTGTERRALEGLAAGDVTDAFAAGLAAGPAADEEMMRTVCECATALLETLKPEYAEVLRRVELDGLAVKQFALERGISQNNTSVRLFRAREALRRQVVHCCRTCADHGCIDCSCRATG